MSVITWPDISGFHDVRKLISKYPELMRGKDEVRYRGKVKIHGYNAGIQIRGEKLYAQTRTMLLGEDSDFKGLHAWMKLVTPTLRYANTKSGVGDCIIFGEWCGQGNLSGCAIHAVAKKIFAVFSVGLLHEGEISNLIVEPSEIAPIVEGVPDAYVLPWHTEAFPIPWKAPSEDLQAITEDINKVVLTVEAEDPWVRDTFGEKGIGEGLVYYPISHPGRDNFSNLAFKAKGPKHAVVAKSAPAQVDPVVAASIAEFAEVFVTPARLEQGARAVNGGEFKCEMRLIGPFLAWIGSDVMKESENELEAAGLEWKQVQKAVQDRARSWFLGEAKK